MANVSGIKQGSNNNSFNFGTSNNNSNPTLYNVSNVNNNPTEVMDMETFLTQFNNEMKDENEGNTKTVNNISSSYLNEEYEELFKTFNDDMKKEAAKIDASINMLEANKNNLSTQLNDKQKELTNVNGDIKLLIEELNEKGYGINSRSLPNDFNSPIPIWMYSYDDPLIKKYVNLKQQQDTLNKDILTIQGNINALDASQSELFYSKFKLDPRYKEFSILEGYGNFSIAANELKEATETLNKIGATKSGFTPLDGTKTYDVTAMEDPAFNVAIMKYNAAVNKVNSMQFQIQTKDLFLHSIGIPFPKSEDPMDLIELRFLDDDQIMFLAYLKKNYGQDKALEYYNTLVGDVNKLKGQEEAMKLINSLDLTDEGKVKECLNNLGIVVETGFADGINTFIEGLKNTILADGKVSVDDYKTLFFLQYLQENAPEYYSAAYQGSSSIGNMAPSVTASLLVTILGAPEIAPTVASILMGASAGGNAREKALQMGSDQLSSILYGCLIGCSETMLGEFLGNIPGISASSAFSLSGFLKEGGEEFLQEYVDAFLQAGILNQEINLDEVSANAKTAFIMGAFTSFLMNGAQGALTLTLNGIEYTFNANQIEQYLEQANGYINNGDVDINELTNTLLGNTEYQYTNASGGLGTITSGELSSLLSNPSTLIEGIKNGTYDSSVISALQNYYVQNFNNLGPNARANYDSIVSLSGIELTYASSISSDSSISLLNQDSNAFSEYCKYLDGLDSDNLTYELSAAHKFYCDIQDGKYVVDGEVLSRITNLENRYRICASDPFSFSWGSPKTTINYSEVSDILTSEVKFKEFVAKLEAGDSVSLKSLSMIQKYYCEHTTSLPFEAKAKYNTLMGYSTDIVSSIDFNDSGFIMDEQIIKNLMTESTTDYFKNHISNLENSYQVRDALLPIHDLYEYIIDNKIVVEPELMEKIRSLEYYYSTNALNTVEQGCIKALANLKGKDSPEYIALLDMVAAKIPSFNGDMKLCEQLLSIINTEGVCSYATTIEVIYEKYKTNPLKFKQDFGYDMYIVVDGKKQFNSTMLLTDLFCTINSNNEGVVGVKDGKLIAESDHDAFVLSNAETGTPDGLINNFLKSKNPDLTYTTTVISTNYDYTYYEDLGVDENGERIASKSFALKELNPNDKNTMLETVRKGIESGSSFEASLSNFDLYSPETGELIDHIDGGHSMSIIGITPDGNLLVDTHWKSTGEAVIKLNELYNSYASTDGSFLVTISQHDLVSNGTSSSTASDISTSSTAKNASVSGMSTESSTSSKLAGDLSKNSSSSNTTVSGITTENSTSSSSLKGSLLNDTSKNNSNNLFNVADDFEE